jgi:ketosteroid isomerase-like protein
MTKALKWAAPALALAALSGCDKPKEAAPADSAADVEAIKQLIITEGKGASTQNIDLTMSVYCNSPDFHLFEAGPYVVRGYDKLRETYLAYFKAFPKAEVTPRDIRAAASGDVGYGHSEEVWKFTTPEGKVREDVHRVTRGYRKLGGKWCVMHENDSIPVDIVKLDESQTGEQK